MADAPDPESATESGSATGSAAVSGPETEHVALAELTAVPQATAFPDHEPRTVRLSLDAGEAVPDHTHPGRDIVFHVLDGRIELELDDETVDVAADELVRFPGECRVSPSAPVDATALVLLAPRANE